MHRLTLSKVASYLYHHQSDKQAYNEIWEVLKANGLHCKTPIVHEFTAETKNIINLTINKLEAQEKALQKLKK